MDVSLVATTSRKISGQAYFVRGVGCEVEHGGDLRAVRRRRRRAARSRRKIASLPVRIGLVLLGLN